MQRPSYPSSPSLCWGPRLHSLFRFTSMMPLREGWMLRCSDISKLLLKASLDIRTCHTSLLIQPISARPEAVIRVNSQSRKGGIAYLVKQHLHLDCCKFRSNKSSRLFWIKRCEKWLSTTQLQHFHTTYHFGGPKCQGRLALRNFKISVEPSDDSVDARVDTPHECQQFDGTLPVDGVYRVIRGDGNGPLSALLDPLHMQLDIDDLVIRDYTEHSIGEGTDGKAASYVELVPAGDRKSTQSW